VSCLGLFAEEMSLCQASGPRVAMPCRHVLESLQPVRSAFLRLLGEGGRPSTPALRPFWPWCFGLPPFPSTLLSGGLLLDFFFEKKLLLEFT